MVLSFGAVAFALTATGKARSASLGIASLVALGGYIIDSLAGTVDWLRYPAKIFPFHYYDPESILRGDIRLANFLFFIALIAGCAIFSWLAFRHRDIR